MHTYKGLFYNGILKNIPKLSLQPSLTQSTNNCPKTEQFGSTRQDTGGIANRVEPDQNAPN